MLNQALFIFHGSLTDFLHAKKSEISYSYHGTPAVKDAIEALGVPHPEVKGIYVNGSPADFSYKIQPGDKVGVFPAKYKKSTVNLYDHLPNHFILDVHLGKLVKDLRMLGFDSLYTNDYSKKDIAEKAEQEDRIVLSRDTQLLKNGKIRRGYWLRSQYPDEQLTEVVNYFGLIEKIKPFSRCMVCNAEIRQVEKKTVEDSLPPKTRLYFNEFYQCTACSRIYWKGSHFERMEATIKKLQNKLKQ